jgi:putative OPT family oligopeptide transporter
LQEYALLIGCISGAAVIPPVMTLLYHAYGFVGTMPRPGMDTAHALAAPQPTLMATIAQGIFLHQLDWTMISIGAALGAALIAFDLLLRKLGRALPPLAVGMGIYLPADVSVTLAIGGAVGWLIARRDHGAGHSEGGVGTMLASGLIVGESLMGVALAAVAGFSGRDDALALPIPGLARVSTLLGAAVFSAVAVWFWRRVTHARRGARRLSA